MLAPAAAGGSLVCGLDLPGMLLVWVFQAVCTVPNWMLKAEVSGVVCMLLLKARLLRSLASLHSRANLKEVKQEDLLIKLPGAGFAMGPYCISSLRFSHEVCYTLPWILIGQMLFLNVVDGHYCKANSSTSITLIDAVLLMNNVEQSPVAGCPRCIDVSNLHARPDHVAV